MSREATKASTNTFTDLMTWTSTQMAAARTSSRHPTSAATRRHQGPAAKGAGLPREADDRGGAGEPSSPGSAMGTSDDRPAAGSPLALSASATHQFARPRLILSRDARTRQVFPACDGRPVIPSARE